MLRFLGNSAISQPLSKAEIDLFIFAPGKYMEKLLRLLLKNEKSFPVPIDVENVRPPVVAVKL